MEQTPLIKKDGFKTIKLGTGLITANDFHRAFKQSGCRLSCWPRIELDKHVFIASDMEKKVDLIVLSGNDLGFEYKESRDDIYAKAIELGFQLCPPEVGPQLRLQYRDQPKDEGLFIAMNPIPDSRGRAGSTGLSGHADPMFLGDSVLYVSHNGGVLFLSAYYCLPNFRSYPSFRWVFIKPRK